MLNYYLVIQLTQRKQNDEVTITRNTYPCTTLDEAKAQFHSVMSTYGNKVVKGEDDIYYVYAEVVTIDEVSLNLTRSMRDHVGSLYKEEVAEETTEATETEETTES